MPCACLKADHYQPVHKATLVGPHTPKTGSQSALKTQPLEDQGTDEETRSSTTLPSNAQRVTRSPRNPSRGNSPDRKLSQYTALQQCMYIHYTPAPRFAHARKTSQNHTLQCIGSWPNCKDMPWHGICWPVICCV
jgi:hypothetical protein